MKIYFAGAIRGGREDAALYAELIEGLRAWGRVLTEHVGASDLEAMGESNLSSQQIHDRDLDWLKSSDVLVAEVTAPSLGVGYEIGRAIDLNIDTLCLYRPSEGKKLSAMIEGCPKANVQEYQTMEEAQKIIQSFMESRV